MRELLLCLCFVALAGCPITTVCNTGHVMDDAGTCVAIDAGVDAGDAGLDATTIDAGPCGGPCSSPTPFCHEASHGCVECLASSDCTTPAAPTCDGATHRCVSCTTSADCAHLAGTTVCEMTGVAGVCVECTATMDAACGTNVCDSAMHTCTTIAQHSTGLCGSCVADVQCMTGQLCVPMTFGTAMTPVGSYCLQRQDVTGACAAPYFGALTTPSIDGVSTTTCGLRATTCPALTDYTVRPCGDLPDGGMPDASVGADGGVPDDDRCGVAGLMDGRCVDVPADYSLRCTVPCLGPDDCETGSTCLMTSPRVCSL